AVVVDLVEVDLDAWHVLIVAVRGVARPVAGRRVDLDAQEVLGLAGIDDVRDLALDVVAASDLDSHVARPDEARLEASAGRRGADAELRRDAGAEGVLDTGRDVQRVRQAGEDVLAALERPAL